MDRSIGIGGVRGLINVPTVFNSGFNFVQFWDGRAATLEEQIDGPVNSPIEMGSSWPEVVGKLRGEPSYVAAFKDIYGNGINRQNVVDAIATFERSLFTPNSRFDRFLLGETDQLDEHERNGYELFKSYGCISCHQGVNIGGNMFQTFGVFGNYFSDRGDVTEVDYGRFNITGDDLDRYVFKVPSLRNVELTAPYFYDGSAATLADAIDVMAKYQLGRLLPAKDRDALVAFLQTLTGNYKGEPL